LAEPLTIAAIDAGSNAIRICIAQARSMLDIAVLKTERFPVRLGENVFTHGRFSNKTIREAAKAFRHYRSLMKRFHVAEYRAVATSATRVARNRKALIRRVARDSKIRLEVISGAAESALCRAAVIAAVGHERLPRAIIDLGGGSLEVSLMRDGVLEESYQFPLGTVRLMETLGISGVMHDAQLEQVRHYARAIFANRLPRQRVLDGGMAAACGGNAEALAQIAPGPRVAGMNTLNLRLLQEQLWSMASRDVNARMKKYGVRRDRADVMSIGAVILTTLGRWLGLRSMLVPAVGVREGVIYQLAREHFGGPSVPSRHLAARELLAAARWYARRLDADAAHSEHIRQLCVMIYDQLQPVHRLPHELRPLLEVAAVLHDIGHIVNNRAHHKHGEYLVRYGEIPGLKDWGREMVAALVRYHNRRSEPEAHHAAYAALNNTRRRQVRVLASILRIAEGLDQSHKRAVSRMEAVFGRGEVTFRVVARGDASEDLRSAERKSELFQRVFGVRVFFRQAQSRPRAKVA
jgi:exopolyphosphatase/guanosine-5'-triphosphate,3'-diphosphate pyrophosphatase